MELGAMQSVSTTAANATVPAASDPDGSHGINRGDRGAGESNRPVDSRSRSTTSTLPIHAVK